MTTAETPRERAVAAASIVAAARVLFRADLALLRGRGTDMWYLAVPGQAARYPLGEIGEGVLAAELGQAGVVLTPDPARRH